MREPRAVTEREPAGSAEIKLRMREPLRADIEAAARVKKISMNAEMLQRLDRERSLSAAMADLYGLQGTELLRLEGGILRTVVARAGSSIDSDWILAGALPSVDREIGLFRWALRPDVLAQEVAEKFADHIEAEHTAGRATPPSAEVIYRCGNEDPSEFIAESSARTRARLGAGGPRLIEVRAAILNEIAARREATSGEPPTPDPDIQSGWGDAVMTAGDQGIERQIATARSQIAHLDRLPEAERVTAIKNLRRQFLTWAGLDEAARRELLFLINAADDNPAPDHAE
jgi:hypothetical protein